MKKLSVPLVLLLLVATDSAAHDTYLTLASHHLPPRTEAEVFLMNGTFEASENSVALERMQDVRITGPGGFLERPGSSQWRLTETKNVLSFQSGEPGTYGVGVSIKPRMLEMTAEAFDNYLKHDGVLDILKTRQAGASEGGVVQERYSKHVKALFQVGDERTENFGDVYGFPIEIVPQKNPFMLEVGETLPVQVLFQGAPVANQLVYASYAGLHRHDESGQHVEAVQTRTDANGVARIRLEKKGRWYVRLIYMAPCDEPGVDYESNWATLTFEIQ